MSSKERERLKVLARVKRGDLSLKEAAELIGVVIGNVGGCISGAKS